MFILVHNQKGYISVRTKKLTKYWYRKHLLLQPNPVPCSFNVLNVFAKLQRLKERPQPAVHGKPSLWCWRLREVPLVTSFPSVQEAAGGTGALP